MPGSDSLGGEVCALHDRMRVIEKTLEAFGLNRNIDDAAQDVVDRLQSVTWTASGRRS